MFRMLRSSFYVMYIDAITCLIFANPHQVLAFCQSQMWFIVLFIELHLASECLNIIDDCWKWLRNSFQR